MTLHAWTCHTLQGAEHLRWEAHPLPALSAGQVRVRIAAASLNFPDLLTVKGQYQFKPPLPFVPGSEYAGTVDAVGDGVHHLRVGQPVAVVDKSGGFGTHALVGADKALPLPEGFDLHDAAAFVMTYGTSIHALADRADLRSGQTVLVLGAAGGVGSAAIQISKAMGARVIAVVSTAAKAAFCRQMGADDTIVLGEGDLREHIKTKTQGQGPDVVYDPVGGDLAEPVFRSIAWRGRYLVVGFAQGHIPAVPWNLALLKGASVMGVFWGDFVRREPQRCAQDMQRLAQWYQQGLVKPAIHAKLPMSQVHEAYRLMATRQVMGKVVLVNP